MAELEDRLKAGIVTALGWDAFVAEGVVTAIAEAGSQREVDEIVTDYLGGGKQVTHLVAEYIAARKRQPQQALAAANAAASSASTASASTRQAPSGFARAGALRVTDLRAPEGQEASSPEVVDGLPVRRPVRASRRGAVGGAPGGASHKPRPPKLERQVANCLACGKVYDCRGTFTSDTTAFVESGGVCTFCGYRVSLTPAERSETRDARQLAPPPAGATEAAAGGAMTAANAAPKASPEATTPDAGEGAAVAFKNRLVEADRNSARRTTVVDDQADFFEIDGNAWLSDEERRALRERERAIREAEEARRKRVTVTVDLLGRQVLMADEPEEAAEAAAGGCATAAAAAAATAAEMPQGGGASAAAASAVGTGVGDARQSLRITRNPGLAIHPMFVRPTPKPTAGAADDGSGGGGSTSASRQRQGHDGAQASQEPDTQRAATGGGSGKGGGGSGNGVRQHRQSGRADKRREAGRRKAPPRLQHDDPFTAAATVAPD